MPMVSMPGNHTGCRVVHGYYKAFGIKNAPTIALPQQSM